MRVLLKGGHEKQHNSPIFFYFASCDPCYFAIFVLKLGTQTVLKNTTSIE